MRGSAPLTALTGGLKSILSSQKLLPAVCKIGVNSSKVGAVYHRIVDGAAKICAEGFQTSLS